jgi:hypothetical protein
MSELNVIKLIHRTEKLAYKTEKLSIDYKYFSLYGRLQTLL